MKKLLFSILAPALALAATLAAATSCDEIENAGDRAELWALIIEGELRNPDHYTAQSWEPFDAALDEARRVAGSRSPSLDELRTAIVNLRNSLHALVEIPKQAVIVGEMP
jgi:hypothetical protein